MEPEQNNEQKQINKVADTGNDSNDDLQIFDAILKTIKDRQKVREFAVVSIKLNFIFAGLLFISLVCNVIFGWFATHPDRQYFASDNGKIIQLVPMKEPYRKAADIIQFARDTMISSFTLDFLNWRASLENSRRNYTQDGFKSFLESLQQSGVLDTVRNRRMNMTISAGTGVLTREGLDNGTYVWYVDVPIEIKLAGQTTELPAQKFLATIRVERVSTLDSLEGVGVGQIITRPM